MIGFSKNLVLKEIGVSEYADGRTLYELMRSFTFTYQIGPRKDTIKVPKGFVTDYATIPRIFWNIFPPNGEYSRASVVHDYLYRLESCPRYLADAIFYEGMRILNVPLWKRLTIYYAVRLFGGFARRVAKNREEILNQFKALADNYTDTQKGI
jgi:hypothetical protein